MRLKKIDINKLVSSLILSIVLVLSLIHTAFASDFYDKHAKGWHWYQDPQWIRPDDSKKDNAGHSTNIHDLTPVQQMSVVQQVAKGALDQAILNPTPQNVQYYIEVQNKIAAQGSKFAEAWQSVLLQTPLLNYSISHPYNHLGKDIYLDVERQKMSASIHVMAGHYGLFFFFKSTCPYCHRMAPIIKDFSERYGIAVIPISLDGGSLPEFPMVRRDNGTASQFHVSVVPAVFAVDPHARKVVPLAYGLITENELEERIYTLIKEHIITGVDDAITGNAQENTVNPTTLYQEQGNE